MPEDGGADHRERPLKAMRDGGLIMISPAANPYRDPSPLSGMADSHRPPLDEKGRSELAPRPGGGVRLDEPKAASFSSPPPATGIFCRRQVDCPRISLPGGSSYPIVTLLPDPRLGNPRDVG